MDASSTPQVEATVAIDPLTGYFTNIDEIRKLEYPSLSETTYLDHAGTTLHPKSLIENYAKELTGNLFGNPHSASASSQLSTRRIDNVRVQVLRFFNANPEEFDLIFVPNSTAAIKLVCDAFRDQEDGFRYVYHADAHTSLIGVRELARSHVCMRNDADVDAWLRNLECSGSSQRELASLFAYPAQSNMTGRRLPLSWTEKSQTIRETCGKQLYSLLDAAAMVSTSPLDLSDPQICPDFVALSFYKIFGFPDLGALLVRKSTGEILRSRKYFGGGTVDAVTALDGVWHAKKESSLHSSLEDGTLPFHSIIALESALKVHKRLYRSMETISDHTMYLGSKLRQGLQGLRHGSGAAVCVLYGPPVESNEKQGPVVAFNVRDPAGKYVSNSEVEKLAMVNNIQIRTGGLCNPGGIATYLGISGDQMRQNYAAGQRCGGENDIINGVPTGAIRVSLGSMSSLGDIDTFLDFITEYFLDPSVPQELSDLSESDIREAVQPTFIVESLSVFPIKSCASYKIPPGVSWEVGPKGLAWDREWCLVHEGTHVALSQKRYPNMALIQPEIDLQRRVLRLVHGKDGFGFRTLEISLDTKESTEGVINPCEQTRNRSSNVCGEDVSVQLYTSLEVVRFFSEALSVPCTLARFPRNGQVRQAQLRIPGSMRGTRSTSPGTSIALSNESPILLISRSSVNRLNEQIKQNAGAGKAVAAASFRGNIVIAEEVCGGRSESPYVEDDWTSVQIGDNPNNKFEILGPCQRCQMVCVDQRNAQRRQEPFSTLAKTRRRDGRVWFGMHMSLDTNSSPDQDRAHASIQIGDRVIPSDETDVFVDCTS